MDAKATNLPLLLSVHPLPLRYTDLLRYPPVRHFPLRRKFQCRSGRGGGREGPPGWRRLFRLPAVMGERKEKKGVDLEEEDEGEKGRSVVGPQQMLIRGGGWDFGQLSTEPALRSTECCLFLGYDKLHSSLLQGACLKGLKVTQMTSFSIVSSSYSIFPPTCTHTLWLHACSLLYMC